MANPFDAVQYSYLNRYYNWILRQNNYISAGIAEYLANPASLKILCIITKLCIWQ